MSRNYLFSKADVFQVIEHQGRQIHGAIQGLPPHAVLNTPLEDLVDRFEEQFRLDVPLVRRADAYADQREGMVEVNDAWDDYGRRGSATAQGTIVTLHVPFDGDKDGFYIRPSTFDTMPPLAVVGHGELTITVSGRNLGPDGVKAAFNRTLDSIEKYLEWLRNSVADFNRSLANTIRAALEARKNKLLSDQNLVANIGFPLKPRPDAPKTYIAPVQRKSVVQKTVVKPTAPFKPEPALDERAYNEILEIMHNMTIVMERSPTAFARMGEEDIRQHFLVQLNGRFEGAASGETFNFEGRTDILIRVDGRNIFIAECKFWTGPKGFTETINQLLGYLSWRDTKTAIVIFNRNKDFSSVLKTIEQTANEHPLRKRGPTRESESRLRYTFASPSDANREVTVTVMAFDIPRPTTDAP